MNEEYVYQIYGEELSSARAALLQAEQNFNYALPEYIDTAIIQYNDALQRFENALASRSNSLK